MTRRVIPVTIGFNRQQIVGELHFFENISDEEIINCTTSWGYFPGKKQLMEMGLDPKPKVKIENDPPGLFDQQSKTSEQDLTTYKMSIDRLRDVAIRSGLGIDTVKDLLEKGWTYRLEVDQPDKWVKEF